MFRYSHAIYSSLENYLSERKIPYHDYCRFGIIRFTAGLDGSKEQYEFRIDVFDRGFWIEVSLPVSLPQTEKVNTRMAKFCCRVNRTDNTGGFLVPDSEMEALVYRMRVCCDQRPELNVAEGIMSVLKMVCRYRDVTERLAAGKLSVEKALRILDKDFRCFLSVRLTPLMPKEKPLSQEQLELRRKIQEAMEAWINSQEEKNNPT